MTSEQVAGARSRILGELEKVLVGQQTVTEQAVVAFFAGGHVLLEGVPGLGKTLLAKALATALGGECRRVQFTPDLMPSDILGTNVFDPESKSFSFVQGPVFTDILLADEINRTPPKTQAALLEAMGERQVTVDGVLRVLPPSFFVIATQNPIEYEGTYPLPEAQVDRFLMKIQIGYPREAEEHEILRRYQSGFSHPVPERHGVREVLDAAGVAAVRAAAAAVVVREEVFRYIVQIVQATRTSPRLALGASPRASLALLHAGKVLAALRGREFVTPDDIKELAPPVLRHRLILKPEAEIEGYAADAVVTQVLGAVPVPR